MTKSSNEGHIFDDLYDWRPLCDKTLPQRMINRTPYLAKFLLWDDFVSNKELLTFSVSTTFITYPLILFTILKILAWTTRLKAPILLHFPRGTISQELLTKFSSLITFWIVWWAAWEKTQLQPLEPSTQDPYVSSIFLPSNPLWSIWWTHRLIGNSSNKKSKFSMININVKSIQAFAYICKYHYWQIASTGIGTASSSNGTHYWYCPFGESITVNFPYCTVPLLANCHYWYWEWFNCPISGTGLCQFRYGHLLVPIPELDSMRIVPFPVLGSASSGMVICWAPYQNWTLCVWSHFQYWALPVPVRALDGPNNRTAH